MAYIITEPVIEYEGKDSKSRHIISVKFYVKETHTDTVHIRGARIAVDPESLWVVHPSAPIPTQLPALETKVTPDAGGYAEQLMAIAEKQEKLLQKDKEK